MSDDMIPGLQFKQLNPQEARSIKGSMDELTHEVRRLRLYNLAMWELLRERARLTDEDLLKKVEEIDLRDGVADGKVTDGPLRCPKCGRVSNSRHHRCLYCGLEFERPVI